MDQPLILKRASASRSCGEWSDDDYDVRADGVVVGRILKVTRYRRTPRRCRMVRSHAAARRPKPETAEATEAATPEATEATPAA